MNPLFSIITATYNARDALLQTAHSLQQQTFRDFEWIIIDGGSTDGTAPMLATLPGVSTWVSEKDEGIADAWNKGIARARGAQILLLNAADLYFPQMLEVMAASVGSHHITCAHAELRGEDGRSRGIFRAQPAKLWRGMHLPHNWASVPAGLYSSRGNYRKLRHAMDFDWFYRYYRAVGEQGFRVVDEVLGAYMLGGHSDTHFAAGFRANRDIMVAGGAHPLLAYGVMLAYTANHWLHRRLEQARVR